MYRDVLCASCSSPLVGHDFGIDDAVPEKVEPGFKPAPIWEEVFSASLSRDATRRVLGQKLPGLTAYLPTPKLVSQ